MKTTGLTLLSIIFLFLAGCKTDNRQPEQAPVQTPAEPIDYHSHARPGEAVTNHLSLNLKVDFDQQILSGYARFDIDHQEAEEIVLDARNLQIERVTTGIGEEEAEVEYRLSEPDPILGSGLHIPLEPETSIVTVYYSTTPGGADAVDWLEPQQTAGKKQPFLFTQGQAILTRTWIPCQDSPGIRITYDATIEVPSELMAVMSAANPQENNESGIYHFEMKQPIPPYLIALAVGQLEFRAIGERTGVYAEPSVADAAAYELADMEKMLEAAEKLYGPYLWDRYDVIILPPSFPFGGMENPRLTFATPTIIAGDRSLTSLIAHELAHSWSGNLVTNATWDDFWLNEGFTVYFERRIMEALYGKSYANMLARLGYQDLEADVEDLGPESPDTHLKLHLKGRDPDEGMTDIAYEKGAFFLALLEEKAGRKNFDEFLKKYFEEHRFETITTEEFVRYLNENLVEKYGLDVNTEEWIYGPGIPEDIPLPGSGRFAQVNEQLEAFKAGSSPETLETEKWSTHEWLHFIRHLPENLDISKMKKIDKAFGFSRSGNSEILAAWFELAIRNGYSAEIRPQIESFLVRVGRRKFLTPLYRAYKESGQLETAREIYQKARPNYHAVSRNTMDKLLEMGS
ncbi:MAG: M1 family metallopeptidase [Phaeodactylibacter sp.]|nr:M1 family metallopeptidase [Phaeodactylibacter sp.]